MAVRVFERQLVMAIVAVLWLQSSAQTTTSCAPAIASLSPCLGFITGSPSSPSSSCCAQLASVVQTQAQCICAFVNAGTARMGFTVNQTQALTLPGACNIRTPPLAQCNAAVGAPVGSPEAAPTPAGSPAATPAPSNVTPSTPSPSEASPSTPSAVPSGSTVDASPATPSVQSGSKTVPAGGQSSDSGGSTKPTARGLLFILFVACASSFSGF